MPNDWKYNKGILGHWPFLQFLETNSQSKDTMTVHTDELVVWKNKYDGLRPDNASSEQSEVSHAFQIYKSYYILQTFKETQP